MKKDDSLKLANTILTEIRLLLNQGAYKQALDVAEMGMILPKTESDITKEKVTCEYFIKYLVDHPDRQMLPHFALVTDIIDQHFSNTEAA